VIAETTFSLCVWRGKQRDTLILYSQAQANIKKARPPTPAFIDQQRDGRTGGPTVIEPPENLQLFVLIDVMERGRANFGNLAVLHLLNAYFLNTLDITRAVG
jgi:hypothetical protein